MKKCTFLLSLLIALSSLNVMAQDAPRGPRGERGPRDGQGRGPQQWSAQARAERETARIHQAVNLTDAQIAEVYKVNYLCALSDSVQMAKMREQREQGTAQEFDREAFRKQREEQDAAKKDALKKILSQEQFQQYETWLEEMAKQRQERRGPNGPAPQGERGPRPQGERGPRQ